MSASTAPLTIERREREIGTVREEWGLQHLHVEIELTAERLSISGTYGTARELRRGDGSGGQCGDTFREWLDAGKIDYAPGWTVERLRELLDAWDRWHLNDMRAGCPHQRAGIATGDDDPHAGTPWNERPIDPEKPTNSYGTHYPGQRSSSWNMLTWVRRDKHPEGLLAHPCPQCGYQYGTAWLSEEIPPDVRERLDEITR